MNSTTVQAQLTDIENKLSASAHRLDAIVEEYRGQLPSLADTWIRKEVDSRIKDNPDKVQSLGLERLKELKLELANLIARLPQIAHKETEDRSDWPHYRVEVKSGYGRGENESFFSKAFHNVISHVASILHQFGLLTEPKGHVKVWEDRGNGKFRYIINTGFMFMAVPTRDRFNEAFKEWEALESQAGRLQTELSQAKAKELWDSA